MKGKEKKLHWLVKRKEKKLHWLLKACEEKREEATLAASTKENERSGLRDRIGMAQIGVARRIGMAQIGVNGTLNPNYGGIFGLPSLGAEAPPTLHLAPGPGEPNRRRPTWRRRPLSHSHPGHITPIILDGIAACFHFIDVFLPQRAS